MAIVQTLKSPASGGKAVSRALRDLKAGSAIADNLLGGAEVNLSEPLPVFRLGLDEIGGDGMESLARAKHVGWRYLLERPASNAAGYADVREVAGGEAKFTSLAQNKNAERLIAAAHLAQEFAKRATGDCEARILDVPSLYLSAIWLTASPPMFIPYIDGERLAQTDASVQLEPDLLDRLVRQAEIAKGHRPAPNRSLGLPG